MISSEFCNSDEARGIFLTMFSLPESGRELERSAEFGLCDEDSAALISGIAACVRAEKDERDNLYRVLYGCGITLTPEMEEDRNNNPAISDGIGQFK